MRLGRTLPMFMSTKLVRGFTRDAYSRCEVDSMRPHRRDVMRDGSSEIKVEGGRLQE